MNRISVIIPSYQHAATIVACLESVLAQTRQADEVIVVNDGSTDETSSLLGPYKDRVKLIEQFNQGGNAARNRGFAESTGNLVLFCDADAVLRDDMLEQLETGLEIHPEASYAYSCFRFGRKEFPSYAFDADRLRDMNYIHTSALIRREHFPGFDVTIRRFQDWDVWLTMLSAGHVGVRVNETLFQIMEVPGRTGISQWRPSWFYKAPFRWVTRFFPAGRRYEQARRVILKKHGLV